MTREHSHGLDPSPSGGAASGVGSHQYVTFRVADQLYGIDIGQVREIRTWNGATRLPHSDRCVSGILNLRGLIVPIIDLRTRFNHGPLEESATRIVVIVAIGESLQGLLVDSVSDITTPLPGMISPIPSQLAGGTAMFTHIIRQEDDLLAVVNLDGLLTPLSTGQAPPGDCPAPRTSNPH